MNDPYSLDAIAALVAAIDRDVCAAVENYEMLAPAGGGGTLVERVNEQRIGLGFNTILDALQLTVITALCRIWDTTPRAASIWEVKRRLSKRRTLAVGPALLSTWLDAIDAVEASESYRAIQGYRNIGLAHRHDPNKPDPRALSGARRVVHQDERKLLDATVSVVELLSDVLGADKRRDFAKFRAEWEERAGLFWRSICR
jgi:hypothetical protein